LKDGWEIHGFRFPARGITFAKKANGKWAMSMPDQGQARKVIGNVTIDGKPAIQARLDFFTRPDGEYFRDNTDNDGAFETELPPGKYVAAVGHDSLKRPVPDKPGEFIRIKIVEVEVPAKGETSLELNVTSK